jgi:hypothetical protein
MASSPLTNGLPPTFTSSGTVGSFADAIISLLERMSEEAFWSAFLGERILNLLKRYFGSDVVFLGFIVYLARKFCLKNASVL